MPDKVVFSDIWEKVQPSSGQRRDKAEALFKGVEFVLERDLPGAFVVYGSGNDGAVSLIASLLTQVGCKDRRIVVLNRECNTTASGLAELRGGLDAPEFPSENIQLIDLREDEVGAKHETGPVSLLLFGGSSGESADTLEMLRLFYPRLVKGGLLILDDGQRETSVAAEFFQSEEKVVERPMLWPLGEGGTVAVRPDSSVISLEDRYDYSPVGLKDPGLAEKVPSLTVGDPTKVAWPFLRHGVPHVWRTDNRASKPNIGVLSHEEAVLLHNFALPFAGKPSLEIGCHLGWSTVHLAAADLMLDVIDPALGTPRHRQNVEDSLEACGVGERVTLYEGFSPSIVDAVAAMRGEPWSFAFIDGLHDGVAPRRDAEAVAPHLAETAAVAFHDLAAPAVAGGLKAFLDMGWKIRIYDTMQVMGLAWRGNYEPPVHVPDPYATTLGVPHLKFLRSREARDR